MSSLSLTWLITVTPRYYAYNYNANHGSWSIDVGGQRSMLRYVAVFRRSSRRG
jgi:hypothetical protein